MARPWEFGREAEALVQQAYSAAGWRVLARNWRAGAREIDLIVRRGRLVAFVEVRARSTAAFGHPLATVGRGKRRDVASAAARWIAEHGSDRDAYRFDVVAVRRGPGGEMELERVPHAWVG
jgi:putative endonuclease